MLPKCCDSHRGPGRPKQLDAHERETIILDSAERIILEKGLSGASMASIARAAGMSKRTLYEVFEDRAALFAAIVRRIRNAVTTTISEEDRQTPLPERLRRLLTPMDEKFSDPVPTAILRAMIAEAERQPDLAYEFMQEGPYAMHAIIRAELDRAVAAGEIKIADTAAAARLLADMAHEGVIEHLVLGAPASTKKEAFERRLALAISVFLGGIETTA